MIIGTYGMSVISCCMLAADGTPLLVADKVSIMYAIEAQPTQLPPSDPAQQHFQPSYSDLDSIQSPKALTYILETMVVMYTMRKMPEMKNIKPKAYLH